MLDGFKKTVAALNGIKDVVAQFVDNQVNLLNGNSNVPVFKAKEYTLATLPDAATYQHYVITVTDATGGPTLAISNGTNWLKMDATIVA